MIAEVLAAADGAVPTRIAVDVGPGSFTGARIGLAAALALGMAWACPIDGAASDAFVARSVFARPGAPARLLVVLDASRGQVFVREWISAGPRGLTQLMSPDEATARAREAGAVAGNGIALLGPISCWSLAARPDASSAVWLVAQDRLAPNPLYIRAPDVMRGV